MRTQTDVNCKTAFILNARRPKHTGECVCVCVCVCVTLLTEPNVISWRPSGAVLPSHLFLWFASIFSLQLAFVPQTHQSTEMRLNSRKHWGYVLWENFMQAKWTHVYNDKQYSNIQHTAAYCVCKVANNNKQCKDCVSEECPGHQHVNTPRWYLTRVTLRVTQDNLHIGIVWSNVCDSEITKYFFGLKIWGYVWLVNIRKQNERCKIIPFLFPKL